MKVGGQNTVKVEILGDKFKVNYEDAWGSWGKFQSSKELLDITSKAEGRLQASRAKYSKGLGKGAMH